MGLFLSDAPEDLAGFGAADGEVTPGVPGQVMEEMAVSPFVIGGVGDHGEFAGTWSKELPILGVKVGDAMKVQVADRSHGRCVGDTVGVDEWVGALVRFEYCAQ